MEFSIHEQNGETLVAMRGRFSFVDNKSFLKVAFDAIEHGCKVLVFDLSEVEFLDSSALGILLLSRDRSIRTGKTLVLKSPQKQVRQVIENSRFDTLFEIVD